MQTAVDYMLLHHGDILYTATILIESHDNLVDGVENMMHYVVNTSGATVGCQIVLFALAKTLIVKGHHPEKVNEAVSMYISKHDKQSSIPFIGERAKQFLISGAWQMLHHLITLL